MNLISPKYQMKLVDDVSKAVLEHFDSHTKAKMYIKKWHFDEGGWNGNYENFSIAQKPTGEIDVLATIGTMDGETLIKVAIDLGVETPDFIPSIPTFRNEIKSSYKTASATFERAFRQVEDHPDTAIGLANSALESIIKEILKDDRINSQIKGSETLYELTIKIVKAFRLLSDTKLPEEVKIIANSLMSINQSIEKIRSEKTNFHGKTDEDYIVSDPLYAYFIINSAATVGLFLNSYYKTKFPKPQPNNVVGDELPF